MSDQDLNFLLNKDSKKVFGEDNIDKNSLSFGSDQQDWDNGINNEDYSNGNFQQQDSDDDNNEQEEMEDDVSVFSSEKQEQEQTQQPNLFMNPQSNNTNSYMQNNFNPQQSREQVEQEKQEILYQIERMKKRGITFPRSFSMASSLQDMKNELQRIKRDLEVDASIHFSRKTLVTTVSGLEFANAKFNPLKFNLNGWSENINENINDYDEVFEKLHEKYKSKSQIPPELSLLMMIAGSGFMTHMTNTLFKSGGNSMTVENLLKNNPDLQKHMASATLDHMQQENKQQGGDNDGIINMFKGMFDGNGQQPQPQSQPKKQPHVQPTMKGPNTSDIDDILEELNLSKKTPMDNDRFEVMSELSMDKKSNLSLMSSLISTDKKGKRQLNI